MPRGWEDAFERWVRAGLMDDATATRIRAFEAERAEPQSLRWPVLLALSFGGILLGAGVLLFVAAHWDRLSPSFRFATVLLLVAVFHVAGVFATGRMEAFATLLHGLGTISLGAGIFLAGQIFNLQAHWPAGVMLWAIGAWIGWVLLRDWVQAMLAALLTPAWLAGEWTVAAPDSRETGRILMEGLLLLAFTYLTARTGDTPSLVRRALVWAGGLALIPCAFILIALGWERSRISSLHPGLPGHLAALGWAAALGLPLLAALALRGRASWINLLAAVWVWLLGMLRFRPGEDIIVYLWCAVGSVGLVAWGLAEAREERINLGVAGFALTVLFFYFSSVMDKLGRSVSLMGLGALFLGGGWALERTRRGLVARLNRGQP